MKSKKRALMELILAHLDGELDTLMRSAKAAHEAATHEESKAEDSHDTRGLEASYLAGAQMARIESLRKVIHNYQTLELRDFAKKDPIGIGALVELDLNGKAVHCFLVATGGGTTVVHEGQRVQVITPQSPLGEALLGRRAGDLAEVETRESTLEYEIVGVA
jgi:transcription elongation GreA/GreB family factor